jgi:glycine/D-amino acid oxidase-like deaminating enzyme
LRANPYWLDTAPTLGGTADGPVEGKVDVAIVGAGLTGLSAALQLARRNVKVAVLESQSVVGAASGRNGGQCNVGVLQDFSALCQSVGVARARQYYATYEAAVDSVEGIVKRESLECDFARTGKLKLAAKAAHYDKLAASYEFLLQNVDKNVELISAAEIRHEVDSAAFHGGLLQSTSAQLHVGKFGIGLARAAIDSGAAIFESAEVTKIKATKHAGFRISSARGDVTADEVLVATGGAPSGASLPWFRRRIVPVGSFIIVTEPLDAATADSLFPRRRNYVTTRHIGHHFRLLPDNRFLFGGRARFAASNSASDKKSGRLLLESMISMFPGLSGTRIDYCWGGQIDMTKDRLPRAGRTGGVHYSMGYSGHGVQMSVHMGKLMANSLIDDDHAIPWSDLSWPAIPGHFGKPWFLPAVGAYYRAVDYLQ